MRALLVIATLFLFSIVSNAQNLSFTQWKPPTEKLKLLSVDTTINKLPSVSILRKDNYHLFYDRHLGGMCKLENIINNSTVFPVTLRLGTVQYVDRMEGKVEDYTSLRK